MTTSITSSTKANDIWKNFYDRVKDQVTSIATGLSEVGTSTIQTYSSSFGDTLLDNSDNYPIIIVEEPEIPTSRFTMKKQVAEGTIDISVFARQNVAAVKFKDSIINSIETYKNELAGVGIKEITIEDTDRDNFKRGSLNIHMRTVRFGFMYHYDVEGAF